MNSHGKEICRQLKGIRRKIAEENDIELEIPVCTFEGECRGTCPRCEAEVEYLEREIARRLSIGKAATVAGIAVTLASMTGCQTMPEDNHQPEAGDIQEAEAAQPQDSTDTQAASAPSEPRYATPMGDIVPPPPPEVELTEAELATMQLTGIIDTRSEMPEYSRGEQELFEDIRTLLRVPQLAKENNINGIVKVAVTVEADDSVSDIRVVRDIGAGCGKEALRVIKELPGGWKAARPDGFKPVKAERIIDIEFSKDSMISIIEGGAPIMRARHLGGIEDEVQQQKQPFLKRLFRIRITETCD